MDEEDLAAAAESQTLQTNDDFAGLGSTEQDERRQAAIIDLFKPHGETVGTKLLRKMGWREGQGVGPMKRQPNTVAEGKDTQFLAPTNSKMIQFNRKNDRKGLGYHGEARLKHGTNKEHGPSNSDNEHDDRSGSLKPRSKTLANKLKGQTRKSAFGVGVLNDDDSDDEDPYSQGPRVPYKKSISANNPSVADKESPRIVLKPSVNLTVKSKHAFRPKLQQQSLGRLRKCNDGRLPLDGYVLAEPLASLSMGDGDEYAPPQVPHGWKPRHASSADPNTLDEYISTADAARASRLDARDRAALLGETQLPGKSVFDFITPITRDRLANASKKGDLPPGRGEQLHAGRTDIEATPTVDVPFLDKQTASEALRRGAVSSLRNADEGKRLRYESFLKYRAELRQTPVEPAQAMSTSQWAGELDEFVRSAKAFKPMSGLMASRFTSAGVSKPSDESSRQDMVAKESKPKDPAEEAASLGMFGPLTRMQQQFFPTRLVCKRFGIRAPPHADDEERKQPSMTATIEASSSSKTTAREPASDSALAQMKTRAPLPFTSGQMRGAYKNPSEESIGGTTNQGGAGEDKRTSAVEVDSTRNDALEGLRAGEDVFRAVFGDEE